MERIETDICILGAGSGGLSVAAGAAQMGARVVLIEADRMGGDCLNAGCVPSKALIAAAKQAHAMQSGAAYGVAPVTPQVCFPGAKDHVARAIATIAPHDSQERFEGLGATVLRARGRFVSPREVQAGDTVIRARRFVIATGSRPLVPPIPGLDAVPHHTNETIFELREKPGHLIVVGGGPIGMEMAQAHARLGSRVTVVEAARALGRDDPEVAEVALARLRTEGVEIREGAAAERVSGTAGAVTLHLGQESVTGSHLLVAVGRRANTAEMGLEAAGIAHDARGVTVDAGLRTTNRRVYAIGDAAGGLQFTHVAGYQAGLVVRSALFRLPVRNRTDHVPRVTYTDPEVAQVGLTEAEAREAHGDRIEVHRAPFAENDRARAERATEGLVKMVADGRGRIYGVSMAGRHAGELIQPWALALSKRLRVKDMAGHVAAYPTLGEVSKRVAGAYYQPRLFESARVKWVVRILAKLG